LFISSGEGNDISAIQISFANEVFRICTAPEKLSRFSDLTAKLKHLSLWSLFQLFPWWNFKLLSTTYSAKKTFESGIQEVYKRLAGTITEMN